MDYKLLVIKGISYSQTQSGAYVLLLEQPELGVKLPIVIGNFEAQSISIGLEKDLNPPRPLTHDLFSEFVRATHYDLESVMIYKILDGVFFSHLNFVNKILGDSISIDARTSDAVAMATRFEAPIYTTKQVLNEAGILLNEENIEWDDEDFDEIQEIKKSVEELQEELDEAVKNEDFDLALKLQEEIKNRSKNID
ncbi:MAG: bifunctional nuclease family protein [Flavobacteriaceae bacterium]|nr:bifunctional nuclease family protein [Flavobacteriaceae bacterium]